MSGTQRTPSDPESGPTDAARPDFAPPGGVEPTQVVPGGTTVQPAARAGASFASASWIG